MLQLKSGVKLNGIRTELLLGLIIAEDVYKKLGKDLVITSIMDGKHKEGSFHYLGLGADLRTHYFTDNGLKASVLLKNALGDEFDVILEGNHIHIEYQPKS